MKITELDPKCVWKNFYELTKIPRPSKHEEKVADYLYQFGRKLGLETVRDEAGNVIIRKPATPGMENRKGIILQGHMDMVPQKDGDVIFDFTKDAIQPRIEGEWVYATGTTLGADDGMGVAVALAVLESTDLSHGPLEALFTVDEETGMTGARALKPGLLRGDILVNLDSETEGELYVGCAGGLDCDASFSYSRERIPSGYKALKIEASGFVGGHSGMDIILCRANANKVMTRIILPLLRDTGAVLVSMNGGNMRNSIPRECEAVIAVPSDKYDKASEKIAEIAEAVKSEYSATDKDQKIEVSPVAVPAAAISGKDALNIIKAIYGCPDGVERMSDEMPGMVETSNNMAIVSTDEKAVHVITLMRSSVDSAKYNLAEKIRSVLELGGAEVKFSGGYSGWNPNMESPILKEMISVYEGLFGKPAKVMSIHAGLECGILGATYPNWDMVSTGPTLKSPHSPMERCEIKSVAKLWKFITAVLEKAPEK